MGRHSSPAEARPEPVAIAAAAQAVLAALVTVGWLQLDDATIASVATGIAAILSVVLTLIARSRVTPVSDPRGIAMPKEQ